MALHLSKRCCDINGRKNIPGQLMMDTTILLPKLLEIEKKMVREVAEGNKHYVRNPQTAKHKSVQWVKTSALLICALRSADFSRSVYYLQQRNLKHNLCFNAYNCFLAIFWSFSFFNGKQDAGAVYSIFWFFDQLSDCLWRRRGMKRAANSGSIAKACHGKYFYSGFLFFLEQQGAHE